MPLHLHRRLILWYVMHMHIMVALDDSRYADVVVNWMRVFPPPRSGRVTLVHVVEPLDLPEEPTLRATLIGRQREEAQVFLGRARRALEKNYDDVRVLIVEGFPVYQILKIMRECRPDVVVTGTRGLRGAKGLALGSVSQRLLTYASCSVMLVPERIPSGRRFTALLATDGSRGAKDAARFLCSLPDLKDLTVVTAVPPLESQGRPSLRRSLKGGSGRLRAELVSARRNAARKALQDTVRVLSSASLRPTTKIVTGHPAEVIPRQAKNERCTLLVIGSRGITGAMAMAMGSTSLAVAQSAPCPVLVVKRRV